MASPTIVGTPAFTFFAGAATSFSQSLTVPSTGQNQALIVVCGFCGSSTKATALSFNTTSNMVQIVNLNAATEFAGQMWYLANPPQVTANIVTTNISQGNFVLNAFVLQDCVQTSGSVVDISGAGTGASGTTASKAVTTTANGDFMVTWIGTNPSATAFVPGGTQVSQGTHVGTGGGVAVSTDSQASSGSYTGSYNWTTSSDFDIFVAGLKYVAPTGGGASGFRTLLGVGI